LFNLIPDPKALDPYDIVAEQDEKDFWIERLSSHLSDKENIVFRNFLNGKSYREIADILGIQSTKPVGNALTRCRSKAREFKSWYNKRHTVS